MREWSLKIMIAAMLITILSKLLMLMLKIGRNVVTSAQ